MTDPEREHLRAYIRELECSRGRWRLATLGLAVVLCLPIVLGGLLGLVSLPRMHMAAARAREAELQAREAMEAERQARQAAIEAQRRAEELRRQADDKDKK